MSDPIEVRGRWWRPSLTKQVQVPINDQPRRFFRWLTGKPLVEDIEYTVSVWIDAPSVGLSIHVNAPQLTAEPVKPTVFDRPPS